MKIVRFVSSALPHIQRVIVAGESMAPTLVSGQTILFFRPLGRLKKLEGKVVLIQRISEAGKDFLQIKRVIKVDENGIWVEGDNKNQSTDSRSWGYLRSDEILGRQIKLKDRSQIS